MQIGQDHLCEAEFAHRGCKSLTACRSDSSEAERTHLMPCWAHAALRTAGSATEATLCWHPHNSHDLDNMAQGLQRLAMPSSGYAVIARGTGASKANLGQNHCVRSTHILTAREGLLSGCAHLKDSLGQRRPADVASYLA